MLRTYMESDSHITNRIKDKKKINIIKNKIKYKKINKCRVKDNTIPVGNT